MESRRRTVSVRTLGCSKNTVDSEELMAQLDKNRLRLGHEHERADVAIINTCGFIEAAKKESIDSILEAVDQKKAGAVGKVVVMGCLSERYAAELRREIPEVDVFLGAGRIEDAVRAAGGEYKYELLGERMITTPAHFAYLKISEGCDRPCSFCAIPLMRGAHRSKPVERVILEARRLAALGVKELILIAQDSTYYGLDIDGARTLAPLLDRLAQVDGIEWIRLLYAYPSGFPLDVLEQFAAHPKICRYIDIPVQHFSDRVLASMKRGITGSGIRKLLGEIRSAVPGIALRSTLITGYPAEEEEDFRELLDFVREGAFDRLGVFTYSQEEGTAAYPLGDPVPQEVKEERRDMIMDAQREVSRSRNERLVGRTLRVLIDGAGEDGAFGRSEWDAPEVDNEVVVQGGAAIPQGSFCDARIVDADAYDLFAIPAGGP
jgi:ribosomal protein S12 methylthiotransferase